MYEFLKIQYLLNRIDESHLTLAVTRGWITEEQKEGIISRK